MANDTLSSSKINLPPIRLKSRAPVYNQEKQMYFFNEPFKNLKGFYNYFSSHTLKNEQLSGAQDGIYTWVMIAPNQVYAIRTRSSQEIGSLHDNIMSYIRYREHIEPVLIASGELQIITDPSGGKTVIYNFQSSLFCQQVLRNQTKKRKQTANAFECELADKVISTKFQELFPGAQIQFRIYHDLIEDVRILSSPNIIHIYNQLLTRKNITNKQKKRHPPRNFINHPNYGYSLSASSATASSAAASSADNSNGVIFNNRLKKNNNTKRQKIHTITDFQPFVPSVPLEFHMGVPNNNKQGRSKNSRSKTERKSRVRK